MNKIISFFKPKFRIRQVYDTEKKVAGYLVEVRIWWFPFWIAANMHIVDQGKVTTSYAIFNDENSAGEYILRRYTIYSYVQAVTTPAYNEQEAEGN